MNYGKFFRLNNNKSDIGNGIAVFDYIQMLDTKNKNGIPKYPIYLTITKDGIDFRIHYYDETPQIHIHNIILSLPLSANLDIKDGLTSSLVEGWETTFPTNEHNYLHPLVVKSYPSDSLSYFNLKCFNNEGDKEDNQNFIRKLILDFMFDLEQTKVFQTSPHYEHISIKLKENYFFSALAAKANFYYYRGLLDELVKEKSIYAEYCLKAEKQWTKAIRSAKANANFNGYRDHWFDDPEKEMDSVYDNDTIKQIEDFAIKNDNKLKEEIEKSRNLTSKWYMERFRWESCGNKGVLEWLFKSHFLLLRFVAAITTAWITILIGSDLLPAHNDRNVIEKLFESGNDVRFVFFCLSVMFMSGMFIRNHIKLKNSGIKEGKRRFHAFFCRPLKVLGFCIVYSSVIGTAMSLFTDRYYIGFNPDIRQLSPFFCTGVMLAVFIGIVLESVTEKKTPEEE
ncbi:MAG: hypothetical protein LBR10_14315 [Prevotellaceae bacterium]|jgi:hypothetical protein|nr:hypothetical protein [Prevotellaceae bacterium]